MDSTQHNVTWERRQTELWDRIFQVTQDVVSLAESLDDSAGGRIMKEEMVRSAMAVGRHLVRATAADGQGDFESGVKEARLSAIETDYWLRLTYIVQQREDVQRDLSSVITQYSSVVDLLQKMMRHVHDAGDAAAHKGRSKIKING